VALLVLSPLLGLTIGLVDPPPDPLGAPAASFGTLLGRSHAVALLGSSVALAVGVAVLALLAGAWLAWAEQRLRYPGRRVLAVVSLLPLATPSYVAAATFAQSMGPGGWVGGPLGLPRMTGLGVAVFVLAVVCVPYVHLLVGAALARTSAAEEEAARALGAGAWRVAWTVVFPRVRAALALSALLCLLYAISDFGAVAVLDAPVLTWRLYGAVKGQELAQATLLGAAVLGVTVPLFALARVLHGARQAGTVANPRLPARRQPGAAALAATYATHAVVIGAGVVLPVVTLVQWVGVGLRRDLVFASPWTVTAESVAVAAIGAVVTGALAWAPAWVAARDRRWGGWVEQATLLTSALPGVLLALGLVLVALAASRTVGDGRAVYAALTGSGVLLLAGYAVRFLAEGFAALKTAVLQIDRRQEESALALGVGRALFLRRVGLPAMAPGVAAASLLLFLAVLKELPVTLLLGGAVGVQTLAFRVWDRYSEAMWHDAGVAALLLEVVALAVVLATLRWRRAV